MDRFSPAPALWRKSSRSFQDGNCVEVAGYPFGVAVRDSKDGLGPMLVVPRDRWSLLANEIKRGLHDL